MQIVSGSWMYSKSSYLEVLLVFHEAAAHRFERRAAQTCDINKILTKLVFFFFVSTSSEAKLGNNTTIR